LAVSGWLVGCAGAARDASGPSPLTSATDVRRPDAVVLEPPPAQPTPVVRARAKGVVALQPGFDRNDLAVVVSGLLRAYETESVPAVLATMTPDVVGLYTHASREQLRAELQRRFSALEFQILRGADVAHVEDAEVREYDDLPATGRDARPPEMQPGDVLVRIPMTAPLSNGERLFDDVLVLLLRRDESRTLRIAGIGERSGS
jgi:hypothetical protein